MNTKNIATLLILSLLIGSCNDQRLDTSYLKQAIDDHRPKRILPEQLVAQIDEWGTYTAKELNRDLKRTFGTAMVQTGLENEFKTDITFFGKGQLSSQKHDAKAQQILEAYLYNAQNNLPQNTNIQKLTGDTLFFFTAPVLINDELLKIDSLKNRKKGDLLGVWGITFSKREVIRKIDIKNLKNLRVKEDVK
jgi:hypothetical protein